MITRKQGIQYLFLRIFCCLLSGVVVSMSMFTMLDTYSWFSDTIGASIEVNAASTKDIIEKIILVDADNHRHEYVLAELVREKPLKQQIGPITNLSRIILQGAKIEFSPVIFFSVEGAAKSFIQHINPISLTTDEISADITISPDIIQLASLKRATDIKGHIKLKYLNEFIDFKIDVSFTPAYLHEQIMGSKEDKAAYNKGLTEMISFIAGERTWEEARWEGEGEAVLQLAPMSFEKEARAFNMVSTAVVQEKPKETQGVPLLITKLEITDEQQQLLDILVPRLTIYLEEMYQTVVDLVAQLNEKIVEIVGLTAQVEKLAKKNEDLVLENKDLKLDNESLLVENQRLEEENNNLLIRMDDMQSQIFNLQNQLTMTSSGGGGGGGASTPPTVSTPEEPPTAEVPGEVTTPEEPPAGEVPGEVTTPEEPPAGEVPGEVTTPEEPPAGEAPGEVITPEEPPADNLGQDGDTPQSPADSDNDGDPDESIKSLKVNMFEETAAVKKEEDEVSSLK